jgi:hypothetical protein
MKHSFSYDKKKVIQGLRFHFISRPEIRILIILVNVFAIISAIFFYLKKISPEPFLLSSAMWILLMLTFWYFLPLSVYKRAVTFTESFTISFFDHYVRLDSSRGHVDWNWGQITTFFESPNFFHLYFSTKSFFLIPKEGMSAEFAHDLRGIFKRKIEKNKV